MAFVNFFKKYTVFCIAAAAAVITCFLVPPDKEYLGYFDLKTLSCLFITLAVVCALRNISFFTILARRLVLITGNLRNLFLMLLAITFLGSMLIANDMALITFLPLGYFALTAAKEEKYMAYLFVMQNISANLGGMLTPFGNPQNLYLYSYFNIPTGEFCSVMLPPFLLAVTLICLSCLFVKPKKLSMKDDFPIKLDRKRTAAYLLLFAVAILVVLSAIDIAVGMILIIGALLFLDRLALKLVDYPLLMTFFFFFVFSGNLSRINAVNEFVSSLLARDTLLVSVLSCQFISNVPSAILLSRFTSNYRALLLGVNIGGTGTLIASLASLITFNEYRTLYPKKTKVYISLFSVLNAVFLIVMTVVATLFWT